MSSNGHKPEIKFDLTAITAREIAPHLPKVFKFRPGAFVKLLPLVVIECSLGDPKSEDTYNDLPIDGALRDIWQAYVDEVKTIKPDIPSASFDLTQVSAREFDALMQSVDTLNIAGMAEQMARFVKSCPLVDDVSDAQAYLSLPYYSQFAPLMNRLHEAGTDLYKRFLDIHL